MVIKHIQRKLQEKSESHSNNLHDLGRITSDGPLSPYVQAMPPTPQFLGMNLIMQDPATEYVDFVFYFDRLAGLLIEK